MSFLLFKLRCIVIVLIKLQIIIFNNNEHQLGIYKSFYLFDKKQCLISHDPLDSLTQFSPKFPAQNLVIREETIKHTYALFTRTFGWIPFEYLKNRRKFRISYECCCTLASVIMSIHIISKNRRKFRISIESLKCYMIWCWMMNEWSKEIN